MGSNRKPYISVVLPCLNEERSVGLCVHEHWMPSRQVICWAKSSWSTTGPPMPQ